MIKLPLEFLIAANLSIMHKQPMAIFERMAITAINRGPGGGADMCKKQR